MIHVVIPAAGSGSRFTDAGYANSKPLIDVLGQPMIRRVLDNVSPPPPRRATILSRVPLPGLPADVVLLAGPTRGAVETILQARIGTGPLLVANCDQLTTLDMAAFCAAGDVDVRIATFRSAKPHHSYVECDERGYVSAIAEKRVISPHAVAGVYFFADGLAFVDAAQAVLDANRLVLGEFYVSTVLAEMLTRGAKLTTTETNMAVLGTPEELDLFLSAAAVARWTL